MKGARHLSREEIQNLAQSFYGEYETRNRTLFLLGLNLGTRISELLSLNVGDVWQYEKPVEILELRKAITKGMTCPPKTGPVLKLGFWYNTG